MKLYFFPIAPNPTRVLVYIREKGICLDEVPVNLREGEQRSPEHLARNPRGALPVLETDSGDYITESLPIIEYLEELYPRPPMIGDDPLTRAKTRELERLAELKLLQPIARLVHATNSPLGIPPEPLIAERERSALPAALQLIDERIGSHPFAAGERPTIVDCTLFAALQFGEYFGWVLPDEYANLQRWYCEFRQRPSTRI